MKRVIVLALSAVVLSGCLGDMPSSGPINYGRENLVAPESNFVRTIVSPPAQGADPAGIVRGFMAASAGDSGSFSTARLYLAPEVREEWRPLAEIRVVQDRGMSWKYDNLRSPGLVRFEGTQVATINSFGEYRRGGPEEVAAEFRLRLINQEWRISALPDGLTLSQSELGRSYRAVAIYYPDRTRSVMVPNLIYLPVRPALPTAMVRALLRGPTPWIRPAVRTGFPNSTTLQVNSVPVVDGVAIIDLSDNVARASSEDRILLSAQLVHTLRQVTDVRAIRITSGGVDLSVPGIGRIQNVAAWSAFAPDAGNEDALIYFSSEAGLTTLSLAAPAAQPRLLISNIPDYTRGFRWPSVSLERDRLLALDAGGNVVTADLSRAEPDALAISGLTPVLASGGRDFLRPRLDISATYWVAHGGIREVRVFAGRVGNPAQRVAVPTLRNATTTAFAISRDGSRAAVALTGAGSSAIYLLRVARSGRGNEERFALEEPILLGSVYGSVTDMSWSTSASLVVLGGQPGSQRQLWTVPLNGDQLTPLGPPLSANAIAVAPGRSVAAETVDGRLVVLRDQRWSSITIGRYPSYSG